MMTLRRRKPARAASVWVSLDCFTGAKKIKILTQIKKNNGAEIKIKNLCQACADCGCGGWGGVTKECGGGGL